MLAMSVIPTNKQIVDIPRLDIKTPCIDGNTTLGISAEVMPMNAKSNVLEAHEAMAAVLDAKFANVPEWKAFRAIDRALISEIERGATTSAPAAATPRVQPRLNGHSEHGGQPGSYNALTDLALKERGKPIPTPLLMAFIAARRKLDPDLDKAKNTVTSTLSKHPRYRSVPWEGGQAWWYADRPVPKNESAG
jgi:hypothetical protein